MEQLILLQVDEESRCRLSCWSLSCLCRAILLIGLFIYFTCRAPGMEAYDDPCGERMRASPSPQAEQCSTMIRQAQSELRALQPLARLQRARIAMDEDSNPCGFSRFRSADHRLSDAARARRVGAGGELPSRPSTALSSWRGVRGGKSFEPPPNHLHAAEATGCSVLVAEYRLMPEHKRAAGIADSQHAYAWLLEHGPQGRSEAHGCFYCG